ncbi:nuclear transport factor 2 family protein [Sphingomonas sp. PsM26]|nr:nuclear transport factor 2 family protein [Sphingomonas sp. PsM26]
MDTIDPRTDSRGGNTRELVGEALDAAIAAHPALTAVLAASDSVDRAIVTGDKATFLATRADDCVVNTPGNRVAGKAQIADFFERGQIDYAYYHKRIEHLEPYGPNVLRWARRPMSPATERPRRRPSHGVSPTCGAPTATAG